MAVLLEGGCRVSDMREGDPLTEGTLRIWKQLGRASGAQAISLRVMEFAPGLSPGICNDDCDEILFVLDSTLGCERDNRNEVSTIRVSGVNLLIDGRSYEVDADSGIYIRPGETFALDNPGPDSITIISSQCPDPDRQTEFVNSSIKTSDSESYGRPPIVRLADRRAQPTADRWYRVLVDDEIGSEQVTQFVGSLPPGRAPDHFHNYEEVLFILKGEGRMWAGETTTPIAAGACIFLPKGQVHCVENTGKGELRLLGVFYPAGSPSVRYEA
ncbi:MAG TPA: cupin domain-containing protein [Pyrinomonadaceae bacterium]|nr:cupin domain-containing protein [Pyrinomonadaceae bacterium]